MKNVNSDQYRPIINNNFIADTLILNAMSNEYLAYALLSYLSQKNLIDYEDFQNYLRKYYDEFAKNKYSINE